MQNCFEVRKEPIEQPQQARRLQQRPSIVGRFSAWGNPPRRPREVNRQPPYFSGRRVKLSPADTTSFPDRGEGR